jgi:hypothetical protein
MCIGYNKHRRRQRAKCNRTFQASENTMRIRYFQIDKSGCIIAIYGPMIYTDP